MIDPKTIEKWRAAEALLRRSVAEGKSPPGLAEAITDLGAAGVALLAEREELLSERDAAETQCAEEQRHGNNVEQEARALLRAVEWVGVSGDGTEFLCPICWRRDPNVGADGSYAAGHAPDCRLDAFLR